MPSTKDEPTESDRLDHRVHWNATAAKLVAGRLDLPRKRNGRLSMSRTKNYLQKKTAEKIPAPALDLIGKAVLRGVDTAVANRWDSATLRAAQAEGNTPDAKVRFLTKKFRKELVAVGAATGAVAAAPGVGTAAAASALAADLGWFAMRATDLIMAIGAVHGHTESTTEERRAWVLSVLAFGDEAAIQFESLLTQFEQSSPESGQRLKNRIAGVAGTDAATLDALRRINSSLAGRVVAKFGSRRSVLAFGKLMPFGVGAAVGGSANYALVRAISSHANKFFDGYSGLTLNAPMTLTEAAKQQSIPARSEPAVPGQRAEHGPTQFAPGPRPAQPPPPDPSTRIEPG